MSDLASHTPADPALVAHLTAGIAEARAIYELLFPTQQLFFVLSQGNNPIWAAPEVIEGPPASPGPGCGLFGHPDPAGRL